MRRFRRNGDPLQRSDPADAKDLVDLAARMGIPPDDAMREVERLISDRTQAGRAHRDMRGIVSRVRPLSRDLWTVVTRISRDVRRVAVHYELSRYQCVTLLPPEGPRPGRKGADAVCIG
jgi:hypothetical protein